MFSKENRPGFGTALVMALPLLGACSQNPPPTQEQITARVTELSHTETLRPVLESRIQEHCPEQYKEMVDKALAVFDATHALIVDHSPNWDQGDVEYAGAQRPVAELREYLFAHRGDASINANPRVEHSADRLLISSGAALDSILQRQSMGDRREGGLSTSTSNSNLIALSELKTCAAALIFDCTAP